SLTDATSFAVMERLKIPYTFAFDRNFTQYGLTVLTVDVLQLVRNIASQHFTAIFDTCNIMELKTIYGVVTFI
ncbi:hypothetical protein HKBW3S43_01837, partial [Candidatus Hakubella thermalkaliphila]